MLLCARDHKEVDDNPRAYSRATLEGYKAEHEERIRHVSGLGPDMKTSVVQLKARIAGDDVDIPINQVFNAVAPRWPIDRRGHVIDLTAFSIDDDSFVQNATQRIDQAVNALYAPGMDVQKTRHVSLFALAPIPLLVYLGRRLSNKYPVDLFQRHRDMPESPWTWRTSGKPATFGLQPIQDGGDPSKVALVLSLSGPIARTDLPTSIDEAFTIYEIRLTSARPNPGFLRQREDLESYRSLYRAEFLPLLMEAHPGLAELHIFPAIPAPVAVACGHDLLPKVHPTLLVYDYDKAKGGFAQRMRINDHETR